MPRLFGIFATHSMGHIPARCICIFVFISAFSKSSLLRSLGNQNASVQTQGFLHLSFSSEKILSIKGNTTHLYLHKLEKYIHRGNKMHERNLKINIIKKVFFFSVVDLKDWRYKTGTTFAELSHGSKIKSKCRRRSTKSWRSYFSKERIISYIYTLTKLTINACILLKYDDKFSKFAGDIRYHRDPCLWHIVLFRVEYQIRLFQGIIWAPPPLFLGSLSW